MKWLSFIDGSCDVNLKKIKDKIYIFISSVEGVNIGLQSEVGININICNESNATKDSSWKNFVFNNELNVWYRPLGSLTVNQLLPYFPKLRVGEVQRQNIEINTLKRGPENERSERLSSGISAAQGIKPINTTTENINGRNVGEEPKYGFAPSGKRPANDQIDFLGEGAGSIGRRFDSESGRSGSLKSTGSNHRAAGDIKQIDSVPGAVTQLASKSVEIKSGSWGNWYKQEYNTKRETKANRIINNIEAIRIIKEQINTSQPMNVELQNKIDAFTGWGGLADEIVHGEALQKLSNFLDDSEVKSIKSSALYGYFTSDQLVKNIWDLLVSAGFKGGRIIEPSCATGKFISNRAIQFDSVQHFTGVEIDKMSAQIAKALHPNSLILDTPFEKAYSERLDNDSFDLVIGNFPFGEQKIIDENGDSYSIHNYFILKNIALLRKGGVMAIITSTHTLDSKNIELRKLISNQAQLLTAVRLPSGTFEGTGVVSDLLIFRKRTGDQLDSNFAEIPFINLDTIKLKADRDFTTLDGGKTQFVEEGEDFEIGINEAFTSNNKKAILCGTASTALIGMGSRPGLILKGDISDVIETIKNFKTNAERWFDDNNLYLTSGAPDLKLEFNFESNRPQYIGNFIVFNNQVFTIVNYQQKGPENWLLKCDPYKVSDRGLVNQNGKSLISVNVIKDYVELRDIALDILKAESVELGDELLANKLRLKLNDVYERFVENHGYLNEKTIRKIIRRDALIGVGLSLEIWDRDNKIARKSEIFTRTFSIKQKQILKNITLQEAVSISFSEYGKINSVYIEEITGKNIDDMIFDNPGIIFKDPESKEYIHRAQYLVGNVVSKLETANAISKNEPRYLQNVKYLEEVKPPFIFVKDIDISFGAKWLPEKLIKDYIYAVFKANGADVKIKLSRPAGDVAPDISIKINSGSNSGFNIVNSISHGTAKIKFEDIIFSLMTSCPLVVRKQVGQSTFVDTEETISANNKAEFVRDDFKNWIMNNQDLTTSVEEIYNSKVNVYNFDVNLSDINYEFKGLNPNWKPKAHQIEFVIKALLYGNMLDADCVGAGKTAMQIMLAHELNRLGLARLPFIIVPNHILYQTAAAAQNLFPNAKICIATKEDFNKENRTAFIAKSAMNDWNFGIITYAMAQQLMPNSEYLAEKIKSEIADLEIALKQASLEKDKLSSRNILLKLRKAETELENLIDDISSNRFPLELGHSKIDAFLYDEFHKLKNLSLNMVKSIPGISNTGSNIAFIEYVKMQYIMETYYNNQERGIYGFTATPISNSLAELYTTFRMLKPSLLKAEGISNFNDWAAQYAEIKSQLEVLPEGKGFQMKARLSTFKNLPELLGSFRTFTQANTREQLKLPSPKYEENTISCEPNIWQEFIFETLVKRAKGLRTKSVDSDQDNFLHIVNDAAMAAISHQALFPNIPLPDLYTKLDAVCENFVKIYNEYSPVLGTQLIFLDRSVASKGKWNAYQYCKDKLISLGIPESELVFIHDFATDESRAEVFSKIRSGSVRGCFGSTEKLGTGTDVQDRLIAIHDGDIPWTPKELEQRLGRVVRQGNMHEKVFIYRYTTKGSFDVFRLETIKRKDQIISAAFSSPRDAVRRFEEETTIDYDTIIAETTDYPVIRVKAQLDAKIQSLQKKADDFATNISRAKNKILECNDQIQRYDPKVSTLSAATQRIHKVVQSVELAQPPTGVSEAALKRHQAYNRLAQAGFTTFGSIVGIQDGTTSWVDLDGAKMALEAILDNSMNLKSVPVRFEVYGESAAARRTWINDHSGNKEITDEIRYFDGSKADAEGAFFLDDHYGSIIQHHNRNARQSFLFSGVLNFLPNDMQEDLKYFTSRLREAKSGLIAISNFDVSGTFPHANELKEAKSARAAVEVEMLEIMKEMDKKEAERPLPTIKEVMRAFKRSGYNPNFNPFSCQPDSDPELEIIELDKSNFSTVTQSSSQCF